MSNFISLDQYRAIIQRNILVEPAMLVSNQTQPLGSITFQCPGDNFQMRDITIPASRNAVDLTQYAPLENLLACSQLKSLIQLQRIALLNPEDMPTPGEGIQKPTLSVEPVAGAMSVDGQTIPNATIIVEQNGNVWTGTSNGAGVFTVDVSGLEEGSFSITVTAEGFTPARFTYEAGEQPLQPYPVPTATAVFKETTVNGTTVPLANIVVAFDTKSFTGQADDQGVFAIDVDPIPFDAISLHFEAEGYLEYNTTINAASIPGIASVTALNFLTTSVAGTASPNAEVEILIDGQPNVFATASPTGTWSATVLPVKGTVLARSLEVDGYDEATATAVPSKLNFGDVVIDDADQFGENRTTVSGTIAGLSPDATDIAVTVTVQAGVYEGTVDLAAGTFNITGVDAKAGVGSTGVVDVTSAFYEDGSAAFTILEEFAAPTLQQAVDGQTAVVGDTAASTTVKVTMNGETKTASSNPQGAFSVDGFTNVAPGEITIELSRAQYLTATFKPVLAVQAFAELDADLKEADTTVAGHATPGSTVSVVQDAITGDAVAQPDGSFSITLSGPLVAGQAQLSVQHANYVTYSSALPVDAA